MIRKTFAAALLSLTFVSTAQAAEPSAPAAAAPAAAAHYTTTDTQIGTLLDDPAAKAVLLKHMPDAGKPEFEQARGFTLKQVQAFAADQITDELLTKIDADLAKLPAPAAAK